MFKAVMPNNHNKVLLKKSLRVMDEGLDIARLIKCPQKNRHLLGNEDPEKKGESGTQSPHRDDGSTPESDLPFNKIPWPNFKIFNLWVPRKKSHLLLYCFGQVQAREDVQDRWKMCTEKARSGPRTVCIWGWSLATYRGQRCSPSNSGRDWTCKDTSLIIRRIFGLGSGAWRLSLERGLWIRCVNNYKTFLGTSLVVQ